MSDFKWGTWHPIGTVPPRYDPCFNIWDESCAPCTQIVEQRDLRYHPSATHWMPLPPSPEELAAKPDLERIVREARDYNLRQEWEAWDENGKINVSAAEIRFDCLSAVLAEAGLE